MEETTVLGFEFSEGGQRVHPGQEVILPLTPKRKGASEIFRESVFQAEKKAEGKRA